MKIFVILLSAVTALAVPLSHSQIGERCFAGGTLIKNVNQTSGVSEVCLKDDISMLKSIVHITRGDNAVNNWIRFYRIFIVKDWHDCNPFPDPKGTFTVFEVTSTNYVRPVTYICRTQCEITLDKDSAEIKLISHKMNHYEVSGSTITNGWFKNTITLSLEHTCEHLTVSCGQKTIQFHACFRQHRSCIRFFKNSIMPAIMVESICQNVEIILLTCFSLGTFILLCILTRTYIIYILIPIFYPILYIYGKIYSKYFKLCPVCLLAVHPFTSCPKKCICGARFNNTDQLKVHRLGRDCPGYKTLSKSRAMCKNKGCSFIVAIMLSVMFFSFITPINGEPTEKIYRLEDLPDEYIELEERVKVLEQSNMSLKLSIIIPVVVILLTLLIEDKAFNKLFNQLYRNCSMCGMIHERKGLRITCNNTNKCGTCVCGYSEERIVEDGYESFLKTMHQQTENCKYRSYKRHFRNIKIILLIFSISIIVPTASLESTHCLNITKDLKGEGLYECFGLWLNITECPKGKLQLFSELNSTGLVSELDMPDFEIFNMNYKEAVEKIENAYNFHHMALLEYLFTYKNCKNVNSMKSNGGPYNVAWRTFITTHHLDVCGQYSYKHICRCLNTAYGCHDTKLDTLEEMKTYYVNHKDNYNADLNTVLKTISIAFRGIGSIIIKRYSAEKPDCVQNFLKRTMGVLGTNKQLQGVIQFALMMLDINQTRELDPEVSTPNIALFSVASSKTLVSDWSAAQTPANECRSASVLTCEHTRNALLKKSYLMCEISGQKRVYTWPEKPTIRVSDKICLGDYHCNLKFSPMNADEALKTMQCYKSDFTENPNSMDISITKCYVAKTGVCTTQTDNDWNVYMCSNGKIYQSNTDEHAKDGNINSYCFEKGCREGRHPIDPSWFKTCSWLPTKKQKIEPREMSHLDIESYKKSMESDLQTDLTIHKFRLTQNLPHVVPSYISVVAEGVSTSEGLQNAYIKGAIPAISGLSTGIHVKSPEGDNILDLVLYIKKAVYRAEYSKIYSTGPTMGINVKHNEKCTGTCPVAIPKDDGWLTFSKEHTSNWGCEEYGCMAINSGCVYGSCQDIVRKEIDVYKKVGSEQVKVEVCISLPEKTYCNDLDVLEPLIGDKMQLDFQRTDSVQLPDIIAMKKGQIYTGQINDLGNFGSQCGSVQVLHNVTMGNGNPKFDFVCHAFKRKDIIVRRCYDNYYHSCLLLQPRTEFLHREDGTRSYVTLNGKNLGVMNYRLMLGDLNYKLFTKEPNLDLTGSCAGCINCQEEIVCQVEIVTNGEITCNLEAPCNLYMHNILITPSEHKYAIKMSCKEQIPSIELKVCSRSVTMHATYKPHHDKIDISKLDETNYVKEEDLKCGTWLCKVKEEGISFLFGSIFKGLGYYWSIFIYSVIGLALVLLLIYVFFPLCRRLKGVLERNEIEYQLESKIK
ncbi:glycoprotein precursor [Thimiri virus]|uniref:Envelopment polyprotein n=1 Tax=Orthobunyavirus thimiriense TaxID=3052449 RepID=A0A346JEZ6_9VIRU|nr:glycoprotein precursor [Orthobunyavirus thimiriense]AXP32071.1 glycoprotein precursor [Orthobunyavirus thimiriense]